MSVGASVIGDLGVGDGAGRGRDEDGGSWLFPSSGGCSGAPVVVGCNRARDLECLVPLGAQVGEICQHLGSGFCAPPRL